MIGVLNKLFLLIIFKSQKIKQYALSKTTVSDYDSAVIIRHGCRMADERLSK